MSADWKDKYHLLRAQHTELLRKYHERTEELKRTHVQLSKIENLIRVRERLDAKQRGSSMLDAEKENVVKGLYHDKAKLEARCHEIEKRCKAQVQELEKKKREVAVLRRAARAARRPIETVAHHSSSIGALVPRFKRRIEDAEQELARVRAENRELRDTARMLTQPATAQQRSHSDDDELSRRLEEMRDEDQHNVREAKAEVQLLKMRYDALETKFKAQIELQKGSFQQLEEYNCKIRELRTALSEAQASKEDVQARAERCEELRERVTMLQDTNCKLEDEITKLCQSPFINEAYEKQDRLGRLAALENETRDQKRKLDAHAEQKLSNEHEIGRLKLELERAANDKQSVLAELNQLRSRCRESEAGSRLLQDKIKLYAGADLNDPNDIDLDELEQALAVVRKRKPNGEAPLDFLPFPNFPEVSLSPAELHDKLMSMREQFLQAQTEIDRAERMLKVQMSINRDLHLEVEALQTKLSVEKRELVAKIQDHEALCLRRLQRINVLEAQLTQSRYMAVKATRTETALSAIRTEEVDVESTASRNDALLAELGSGELATDENLVEVWLLNCEYSEGSIASGMTTFAVVDFYNFESQATQWLPGLKPEFDWATSYKVKVDDVFLRYLATESLTLEICEARRAEYEVLARAEVLLAPLLDSRPTLVVERLELRAKRSNRVCGYARLEIRLALPVTELYQLFLDRRPHERANIEKVMLDRLAVIDDNEKANPMASNATPTANELEVVVHSATGLPLRDSGGDQPCAYVHYQLLHFEDTFTPVCNDTTEPTFDHKASFPLASTPQALAVLRTERLVFTVLDMHREDEDDEEVLIGSCEMRLSPIADGDRILATLPLASEATGRIVGALRVAIKWRDDFARLTDDPTALSQDELAWLMAEFSPQKDGQLDYLAMFRAFDAPRNVEATLATIRAYVEQSEIACCRGARDLLPGDACPTDSNSVNDEEFADRILQAMPGLASTRNDMCDVIRHARTLGCGYLLAEAMIKLCSKPSALETATRRKIASHFDSLRRNGVDVLSTFSSLDSASTGRLPRPEFKRALVTTGLSLLDEPFDSVAMEQRSAWHDVNKVTSSSVKAEFRDGHEDETLFNAPEDVPSSGAAARQRDFVERLLQCPNTAPAEAPAPPQILSAPRETTKLNVLTREGMDGDAIVDENRHNQQRPPNLANSAYQSDTSISPTSKAYADLNVVSRGVAALPLDCQQMNNERGLAAAEGVLRLSERIGDWLEQCRDLWRKIDYQGLGLIDRKQFVWVLKQQAPELRSCEVEALLAHFRDGEHQISYQHFLRFCENRPPPVAPAITCARRLCVHDCLFEAANRAANGSSASLPADVFGQILRLGGCELERGELESILDVFPPARNDDVSSTACVDFVSFLAYSWEQHASQRLRGLENVLRAKFAVEPCSEGTARDLFRSFDTRHFEEGLGRDDFERLVSSIVGKVSTRELYGLTGRFFENGLRFLSLKDFVSKLRAGDNAPPSTTHLTRVNWRHLRRRCRAIFQERTARFGAETAAKLTLAQFARYDWRGADHCSVDEFVNAATRAGFGLTKAELRAVGERFSTDDDNSGCQYVKFVSWAAADDSSALVLPKLAASLLKAGGPKWWRAIEDLDHAGCRRIHMQTFERALLDILGVDDDLTVRSIRSIAQKFSDETGCCVVYHDFVSAAEKALTSKPQQLLFEVPRCVARLREVLTDWVKVGVDFRSLLDDHDDSSRGTITVDVLETVFRGRLERQVVSELATQFKAASTTEGEGSCSIRYVEMLHAALPFVPDDEEAQGCWRLEERLRGMVRRKFEWWLPGRLRRAFRHFDTANKGYLLKSDFADGLRALKFRLTTDQERELFRRIDLDKDGVVCSCDLVVFVRDPYHLYLERKVRHQLDTKRHAMSQFMFDIADDDDATIGARGFSTALARYGFDLSSSEIKRLAGRFDEQDDGTVNLERFTHFVERRAEIGLKSNKHQRLATAVRAKLRNLRLDWWRILRELEPRFPDEVERISKRSVCALLRGYLTDSEMSVIWPANDTDDDKVDGAAFVRMATGTSGEEERGIDSLQDALKVIFSRRPPRSVFVEIDVNGSGRVSRKEFKNELRRLGLDVSNEDTIDKLLERFDRDGDGKIDYFEFERFVLGGGEPVTEDELEDLLSKLRSAVRDYDELCFETLDLDDSGTIDAVELRMGVKKLLGYELSTYETRKLMERFGSQHNFNYRQFKDALMPPYLAAVAKLQCLDSDTRRDLFRRIRDLDCNDKYCVATRDIDRVLHAWLDKSERSALCQKFEDNAGRVSLRDFRDVLLLGDEENLDILAGEVRRRVRVLRKHGRQLRDTFAKLDTSGSGNISRRDCSRALEDVGFDELSFRGRLMDRFEVEGDGGVDWIELARFIERSDEPFEEDEVEELLSTLRKRASVRNRYGKKACSIAEAFGEFDVDNSGAITVNDLKAGVERIFSISLSTELARKLVRRFEGGGSEKLRYRDFARSIIMDDDLRRLFSGGVAPDLENYFVKMGAGSDLDIDDLKEGVKEVLGITLSKQQINEIVQHFPSSKRPGRIDYRAMLALESKEHEFRRELRRLAGGRNYAKIFRSFDRDHSGKIDRSEFKRGLKLLGFHGRTHEVDNLMDRIDTNRSGKISFKEFMHFCRGDNTYGDGFELDRVRSLLRRAVDTDGQKTVYDAFARYDIGARGYVDEDDLLKAFKRLGIGLSRLEARYVLDSFPGDKLSCVDYDDLLRCLVPFMGIDRPRAKSPTSATSTRHYNQLTSAW